ncbi:unnamed protein product [Calypogeia fissa]
MPTWGTKPCRSMIPFNSTALSWGQKLVFRRNWFKKGRSVCNNFPSFHPQRMELRSIELGSPSVAPCHPKASEIESMCSPFCLSLLLSPVEFVNPMPPLPCLGDKNGTNKESAAGPVGLTRLVRSK